ncbi:MAG: excisionase family DNA-binding protein [Planctomycetota bacterium]|nr:excisionase family DNA-binding protein [Planctomycetota bacterium]
MRESVLIDVKPLRPNGPGGVNGKKVYTTGEVANLTGLSQQTVIRCFDAGRIGGFRVPGSSSRRIPREELMRFMKTHQIPMNDEDTPSYEYRVLLIDDDHGTIEAVSQALEAMDRIGLDVASTAWEAGIMTASSNPDIVIVSARLCDLDMEQVCRSLQGCVESKSVRIVALARRFRREEMDVLRQLGVETFLRPPLMAKQILDLLPSRLVR